MTFGKLMQGVSHAFLAYPRFTDNKNGQTRGSHPYDFLQHFGHGGAAAQVIIPCCRRRRSRIDDVLFMKLKAFPLQKLLKKNKYALNGHDAPGSEHTRSPGPELHKIRHAVPDIKGNAQQRLLPYEAGAPFGKKTLEVPDTGGKIVLHQHFAHGGIRADIARTPAFGRNFPVRGTVRIGAAYRSEHTHVFGQGYDIDLGKRHPPGKNGSQEKNRAFQPVHAVYVAKRFSYPIPSGIILPQMESGGLSSHLPLPFRTAPALSAAPARAVRKKTNYTSILYKN